MRLGTSITIKIAMLALLTPVVMSSCSKSTGTDVEYLAVKLSDSNKYWSIIELSSGQIIAETDFKNKPSVIVDDMFYVRNDKGEYEFYNINDLDKQVGDTYKDATYFHDKRAIVCRKDEPLMVINTKGEIVKKLGVNVKAANPFYNGYAQIMNEDSKFGFIDTDGNIVIKMEYDLATVYSEDGYAVVGKRNEGNYTFSVINTEGEKLFSFNSDKYSTIVTGFEGGTMAVEKDDKIVYLDSEGKQMLKVGEMAGGYEGYGIYNGLTIYANDEGNFGIKNAKGEIVIRSKYEYLRPNRDGTFLAKKDGQYTVIDAEGHRISRDSYKDIIRVNPDRFIVKEGNSYSIIDKEGNEIGNETFSAFSYDFDNVPAISDAKADTYSSEDTYSHDRQTSEPPEASASIAVDASASIYDYDGVATHDFIESQIPMLTSRELTYEDIYMYDSYTLRLMRNAIFATHNYKFKSADLQEFFAQYPWYTPLYADVSNSLSKLEIKNINFLKSHENP